MVAISKLIAAISKISLPEKKYASTILCTKIKCYLFPKLLLVHLKIKQIIDPHKQPIFIARSA
jgi:hypothetical protein